METVVVTLKLPKDLYSLLQKYGKAFIVNEQFSNNIANKNTGVLISNILENPEEKKIPSKEEVEEEIRRIGGKFTVERVFTYYSSNGRTWPDDWKAALKRWVSYKLEKDQTSTTLPRNAPATCDFSNDTSFKNMVKDFVAENKAKEDVA